MMYLTTLRGEGAWTFSLNLENTYVSASHSTSEKVFFILDWPILIPEKVRSFGKIIIIAQFRYFINISIVPKNITLNL